MIEILNRKSAHLAVFLFVFLIWVGIYLPALGGQELKGEEGRRILPAVTMLKTGNWVVPYIGGVPYDKKPPMINWLVAASFAMTDAHNEWSARLPSVLSILAFVCLVVWVPGMWLSLAGRLVACVVFLTTVAMVEKGRLIEIEALYITLTGMAVFCWLATWMRDSSSWWLWLTPVPFLAAGMLTKGPVILFFYYVAVICILAYARRMRCLLSMPHILSIVLYVGLPAIWAYLAWRQAADAGTGAGMSGVAELVGRMMPWRIDWGRWAKNVFKSLFILLPWILLVPMLWQRRCIEHVPEEHRPTFRGGRLGLLLGFVIVTLMPGNSSRYALPVLGLGSVMLGWLLGAMPQLPDRGRGWRIALLIGFLLASLSVLGGLVAVNHGLWPAVVAVVAICLATLVWRERGRFESPAALAALTAVLVAILMLQYALFVVPTVRKGEVRRPIAGEINALVPEGETLYVFDPGYQAFLFYVQEPMEYVVGPDQLDRDVRYLLIRDEAYAELTESGAFLSHSPTIRHRFTYRHKGEFLLLELKPGANRSAAGDAET